LKSAWGTRGAASGPSGAVERVPQGLLDRGNDLLSAHGLAQKGGGMDGIRPRSGSLVSLAGQKYDGNVEEATQQSGPLNAVPLAGQLYVEDGEIGTGVLSQAEGVADRCSDANHLKSK
jgi:hypothetical protein